MAQPRIGVYVCHCGANIAGKVDVEQVLAFARQLPGVVVARDHRFLCSDRGQDLLEDDIQRQGLDGLVLAACSPLMHEHTFRQVLEQGQLNRYMVQIANIREQVSWVTEDTRLATAKTRAQLAAAVRRVAVHEPLQMRTVQITPAALVVGGGVAGIQAALDLADAGVEVTLVERQPSIGGHMAMFDKTFPTLDCSACILTPKMSRVGEHPKITLRTYSEVEQVSGHVGNFTVTVRRRAGYVDHHKCNGCGVCMEKCPWKADNEFDQGLAKRRAIYVPFAQAVPNKPVIDPAACVRLARGKKCKTCIKFCEPGAIDFDQQDRLEQLKVGSIVVATGFAAMDPARITPLGHGRHDEVYSALQFERLNNAAGPTGGRITTRDGRQPESAAILHCSGSRDEKYHRHCSRVCCMYALKYAHLIREKLPDCTVYNFYIDMRCFGKGYEEFYQRLQQEGVRFIRGKAAQVWGGAEYAAIAGDRGAIEDLQDHQLVVQAEDTLLGKLVRLPVDMVVLTPAMEAHADAAEVARRFSLSQGPGGFFREQHPKLAPVSTTTRGVYVCGTCQGPKDIPDTVAQASAAAGKANMLIAGKHLEVEGSIAVVAAERCSGCKSCLQICPYHAVAFDHQTRRSSVNEALCKGCGTCAAACPGGAIRARHFTDEQIMAEIEGLLSV